MNSMLLAAATSALTDNPWIAAALISAAAVLGQETLAQLERRRRGQQRSVRASRPAISLDTSPIAGLAAALLLPPLPAVTTALVVAAYATARAGRGGIGWAAARIAGTGIAACAVVEIRALVPIQHDAEFRFEGLLKLILEGIVFAGIVHLASRLATNRPAAGGRHRSTGQEGRPRPLWRPTWMMAGLGLLLASLISSPMPWSALLMAPIAVLVIRGLVAVEVEQAAAIDAATGLRHSGAWHRAVERDLRTAREHGRKMALIAIDLDRFGSFNDIAGARAGDRALAQVATALSARHRLVGRTGADEFGVLTALNDRELDEVAQEIVTSIAALKIGPHPAAQPSDPVLTASAGAALFPRDGLTLQALLVAADRALWTARQQGPGMVAGATPGTLGENLLRGRQDAAR